LTQKFNLPETNVEDQFEYFKGIKTLLEANGFIVSHPKQAFSGSGDLRRDFAAYRFGNVTLRTALYSGRASSPETV
jgi:hypothetical protein